ncbi:response regulator transcription factor [Gracilibacillus suaedae]|uniref:response regulator transcription factor n=1 Tax=Gracilibacillus suaedae TaxID=2820273 RepID=UPI001ABDB0B8|nr:response regulator [Gracilibacillus suaedae]
MSIRKVNTVIVDDEPRLRRGIERQVLQAGDQFEIIGNYCDGEECLTAIHREQIKVDLVITDVKMPEIDGLTLIQQLKQQQNFHSIVISGFDDFQYLQRAIREGASDYLVKPIDREEFRLQLLRISKEIQSQEIEERRHREIAKEAKKTAYLQQLQLLQEMMREEEMDVSLLEWTKQFPSGEYVVLYISADQLKSKKKKLDDEEWSNWLFAISNIMEEMITDWNSEKRAAAWKWTEKHNEWWILLQSIPSDHTAEKSKQFAKDLLENIKQYTALCCSIAMSDPFDQLSLLTARKKDLKTAIKLRLIKGTNQIITTDERSRINLKENTVEDKAIILQIEKIVWAIHHTDDVHLKKELTIFLDMLSNLNSPVELEKVLQLLGVKIWNELSGHTFSLSSKQFQYIFTITERTTSITELKIEVWNWIDQLLEKTTMIELQDEQDQIATAKEWILDHLDKQITINRIAQQVFMNPTYFCQQFKNETGVTVHDFVTKERMKQARKLVIEDAYKIGEIARKVGYSDTKYFSKLFKQHYGETPSKYKVRLSAVGVTDETKS